MPVGNSYTMETLNPLSDEFYQRYGVFQVSADDTVVFSPTVWNQQETNMIEPYKVERLRSKPTAGTAVLRKKWVPTDTGVNCSNGFQLKNQDKLSLPEPATEVETKDRSSVFLAIFVRLLLIGHNVLTVWRVTETYNDNLYWLLSISNVLMIAEGSFTVIRRGGIDYKWWCPCFLIYLASTLPAIWLLQIKQYELATQPGTTGATVAIVETTLPTIVTDTTFAATHTTSDVTNTTFAVTDTTTALVNATHNVVTNVTSSLFNNANTTTDRKENATTTGAFTSIATNTSLISVTNVTLSTVADGTASTLNSTVSVPLNTTNSSITTTQSNEIGDVRQGGPNAEIWLIIVEESLIYLLVFSRWLLPRRDMSREFLADLLLEFLAIASDIMELLAVFDESQVRESLLLTYCVMAVWSASFIQFIPVLAQKRMFRHLRTPQRKLCTRCCGTSFVEIAYTCMSIFLQDGPFLVLRLYIMITLNLITYSLVFFVLKNAVTLILLFYRLGIMCYRLPCCRGEKRKRKENGGQKVVVGDDGGGDEDLVDEVEIDNENLVFGDDDVSVNESTSESQDKIV